MELSNEHTAEEDFQHFLSYSGCSSQPEKIKQMLWEAFLANG